MPLAFTAAVLTTAIVANTYFNNGIRKAILITRTANAIIVDGDLATAGTLPALFHEVEASLRLAAAWSGRSGNIFLAYCITLFAIVSGCGPFIIIQLSKSPRQVIVSSPRRKDA